MKGKYPAVRFVLRTSVSSLLAFLLVFSPSGRNVFASCSPASTNGDDTITCTSASDTINAQDGNDQVNGGGGNDSITGGAGNDALTGGTGNDIYYFDTDAALGTDIITEAASGGTDRLDFSGSSNAVTVDLGITGNQIVNSNLSVNMTAVQVENVTGGSGSDILTGNVFANAISGGAGDDILTGLGGNDTLTGGTDNDTLIGGTGNDSYAFDTDTALGTDTITEAASGGTDALNFTGSSNAITVDLSVIGNQSVNSNLILNLTALQMENVTGGSGNDVITGNALVNSLTGGAGNDTLTGGTGNDTYNFDTDTALGSDTITEAVGGGADTLNFSGSTNAITVDMGLIGNQTVNSNLTLNLTAAQVDYITGGSNNDSLTGNALNNIFTGGAGNDTLIGVAGNDSYNFDTDSALGTDTITEAAGGGTDTLNFTGSTNAVTVDLGLTGNQTINSNLIVNLTAAQVENVTGGSNSDTITGNMLANALTGGSGNDILNGMSGNDTLNGGAGNDSLFGGAGDDSYAFDTDSALGTDIITENTGEGTDTLNFSGSSNIVTVDLGTIGNQTINSNLILNLTASQVENVTGGTASDNITGNTLNNVLSGGAGNDSLLGGAGNDTYAFDADSALGTDTIIDAPGGGVDTLNFTGTSSATTVNLGLASQTVNSYLMLNLTAAEMENVIGGSGNDNITGNAFNNNLSGGAGGNDTLNGMDGNDTLTGGAGNDSLLGGAGDDTYVFDTDTALGTDTITDVAGNGTDMLDFSGSSNTVTVNLGMAGSQTVNSNLTLNLTAAQVENVNGGSNNDIVTGNALDNILSGGAGNDTLNGMDGKDTLIGGDGSDTLNGGTDDDQLNGDAGTDILNGGDGSDTLYGGDGDDTVNGEGGNDTLTSSLGVDALDGGADDDQLIITGEQSAGDVVTGGTGQNVFVFQPGTHGSLQLVSNGEDTLDFNLFDSAITIDLNNFNPQNVGGGLNLTLTGLFTSIIGTVFNDTITGNNLNNAINGLGGDDTLSGGAGNDMVQAGDGNDIVNGGSGTDTLDGEADVDKVVNYEAGDTHIDIESGFPAPSTNNSVTPIFHSAEASTSNIPATGKKLLPIKCDENPFSLSFYQGSILIFHNLCNYTVELDVFNGADMNGMELPENIVPLYVLSINLLKGDTRQAQIPEGSRIIWKIPAVQIKIIFFFGSSDNAEWAELEAKQVDGFYEITIIEPGTYLLAAK